MNDLLQKYNDFMRLNNCKAEYVLDNGESFSVTYIFYNQIQERYENFSYDNLTTLNYTDAIINFNPSIINSKIKSDYILFEEKSEKKYNHLCIAKDRIKGNCYIETFFYEPTDKYLMGQIITKIKTFRLCDEENNIIVEDFF